ARRRAEQQALRPSDREVGQRAPLCEDLGERRLFQGDEHLDIAGMCRRGERETRQTADQETPLQVENGTAKLLSRADVAELVDAHGSGPCGRKLVEVQVLSSASVVWRAAQEFGARVRTGGAGRVTRPRLSPGC